MAIEQQRGVLDENPVGVIGEIGQADDLEPGFAQRIFIGGMLPLGRCRDDWHALQMGQRAFG
jgi:hypothetical protein